MKPNEIRAKSEKEISSLLAQNGEELFSLKMKKVTGQLAKTAGLKALKKNIARLQTILREKERNADGKRKQKS